MQPSIDLQLDVIARTLSDAIAPAIGSDNPVARQQLELCGSMLAMVRERLPYRRRFVRAELRDNLMLANAIAGELAEGDDITATLTALSQQVVDLLDDPDADTHALVAINTELRASISDVINRTYGTASFVSVAKICVARSRAQVDKARSWFANCGLEGAGSGLVPVEEIA